MGSHGTPFEGNVAALFADYETTVRGHIRYELIHQNLVRYLGGRSLQVADIGGGSAIDSIWLARQEHSVTLVEPAQDQLRLAKERIAAAGLQQSIQIIQGTVEDLAKRGQSYDLVLSHGVAMYMDDPQEYIAKAASIIKPNGYFSIAEKGYAGTYARFIAAHKYDQADELAQTGQCVNNLGRRVWAFRPEQLEDYLDRTSLWTERWSGIRVLHDADRRLVADLSPNEIGNIIEHETEAGQHLATRGMGQMLHFIAQK